MKRLTLVAGIGVALIGSISNGALAMQSAAAECRDEAISTGLEQLEDIQAYVDQCLQRFAGLSGYEDISISESMEPPVEEPMAESEPVN